MNLYRVTFAHDPRNTLSVLAENIVEAVVKVTAGHFDHENESLKQVTSVEVSHTNLVV